MEHQPKQAFRSITRSFVCAACWTCLSAIRRMHETNLTLCTSTKRASFYLVHDRKKLGFKLVRHNCSLSFPHVDAQLLRPLAPGSWPSLLWHYRNLVNSPHEAEKAAKHAKGEDDAMDITVDPEHYQERSGKELLRAIEDFGPHICFIRSIDVVMFQYIYIYMYSYFMSKTSRRTECCNLF